MTENFQTHLVRFAADVAEALDRIEPGGDLQWYVESVRFGFEGSVVPGIRVVPDEYGGYAVEFHTNAK